MANPGTSKESAINIKTTSRLAGSHKMEVRAVGATGVVRVKIRVLRVRVVAVLVGTEVARVAIGVVEDISSSIM